MSFLDAVCIEGAKEADDMAGDKADIQTPAQQMELDFWGTLDGTRVVSTTAGTSLVPWRAPTKAEVSKAFGDAETTKKHSGMKGPAVADPKASSFPVSRPLPASAPKETFDGLVKASNPVTPPNAKPEAAKSRGMAIKPARYGNRHVLVPRFRS